jgi:hypothetical protein
MPFATHTEFKQFLDGASVALTGKRASTHKVRRTEPRQEASGLSWWRSTGRSDGVSEESLDRNRAYLISYFEAAAGDAVPATGIHLPDGSYVWPDRSVIERSLRDEHIRFDAAIGAFVLTEAGMQFLARA